jgi:hypothetical protein
MSTKPDSHPFRSVEALLACARKQFAMPCPGAAV